MATPYCPARLINESGVELRVASEVELWSRDDNGYVPPKVKHHVMSAVTWPPNGPTSMLSTGSLSWSELVQLNFSGPDGQRALEEFLVNDDLQNYLKTESMQGFVCGMIRMNESGRAYLKADSGSKVCGLTVLESVSYNVDSLFFHLRENPDLCNRDP